MSDHPSISQWLQHLKAGEADAIQRLWDRFSEKLLRVAENRLQFSPMTTVIDGEDVLASVFESLWSASQGGRLQNISNLDEVFWLLLAMTRRKCVDHIRRFNATRRGSGVWPVSLDGSGSPFLPDILSAEPDPHYAVALDEQYQWILRQLPDASFREIAVQKIEGFTNEEIAQKLDMALSTVQRKLKIIRRVFEEELKNG